MTRKHFEAMAEFVGKLSGERRAGALALALFLGGRFNPLFDVQRFLRKVEWWSQQG